ncbi:acylneuraminate cytidylyltransferase family protein [Maricaulaceae bacterium MS644]
MSVLCVIPARGGSKRILRKNVRDFAGEPMLVHALTAALQSEAFDTVHVSTEDDEIAAVAAKYGAPPDFARPASLGDDHTPIRDVVKAVLAEYAARGRMFDTVALVYATAVLIEADDLRVALKAFAAAPQNPLLSVVDAGTPERLMVEEGGILHPVSSDRFANRSQDLSSAYRDAGAFAIFSAETLRADTDGTQALAFRPFLLPRWKGVDIDTEEDWRFAEIIKAGLAAVSGEFS